MGRAGVAVTGWWPVAVGTGLLVWPVRSPASRRLLGLGTSGRVRPDTVAARVRRPWAGWSPALVALLVGCLAVLAVGPALGVAVVAGTGTVALPLRASAAAGRARRFRRDLAVALAVLQGELDAGADAPAAMRAARARAGTARHVLDHPVLDLPGLARPASRGAVGARAGPEARVLAAGAAVVAATGAPWSDVVAGVARDAAARTARDQEVQAALAGSRASMLLLAGLPVLGVALGGAMGAHPVDFLLHTGAGRAVLAVGALFELTGVAVTLALAGRATR